MRKNKEGAAALLLIIIISSILLSFLLLINFQPSTFERDNMNTIVANRGLDLGIDEGIYQFNSNKNNFVNNLNGCDRINSSISIIYNNKENYDLYKVNTDYNENLDFLNDTNFVNNNGFLNRKCSIYEKSYPYYGVHDYVIHNSELTINGINDENGMYYIKQMDRDENKGFIFTTETLKDNNGLSVLNNQLNFKLVYNILNNDELNHYGGIDYLKSTEKYKETVELMQSKGLDITKSSILGFFGKNLENIYNDAKVEIGLIEYDGNYSNGSEDFIINTTVKPVVIKRNLCNSSGISGIGSCELNLSLLGNNLKTDKVYFVYYKTYDKGTTTIFEIQDFNTPVNFITGDLHIQLYGNSQGLLVKENYIKEDVIGKELSSGIFNYLYYSQN